MACITVLLRFEVASYDARHMLTAMTSHHPSSMLSQRRIRADANVILGVDVRYEKANATP